MIKKAAIFALCIRSIHSESLQPLQGHTQQALLYFYFCPFIVALSTTFSTHLKCFRTDCIGYIPLYQQVNSCTFELSIIMVQFHLIPNLCLNMRNAHNKTYFYIIGKYSTYLSYDTPNLINNGCNFQRQFSKS